MPTIEEVRKYRAEHDVSMQTARAVLEKREFIQEIGDAKTIDDLKAVLAKIVQRTL